MESSIFNLALARYHQRNTNDKSIDGDVEFIRMHPELIPDEDIAAATETDKLCKENSIKYVTIYDDLYPKKLKDLKTEAPQVLYIKSATPVAELFGNKGVAVVGTRVPSPYGIDSCRRINTHLAKNPDAPVTIISGLAFGIDIEAHRCALDSGMKTIAVLPCGLDEVYPRQHAAIAARIAVTDGCALVSPFPPKTAPTVVNFFERNYVIAALADSTVIVETKAKGGSMIIGNAAYRMDRKVFAVPGRNTDTRSEGCNALICEGIADILCTKNINDV